MKIANPCNIFTKEYSSTRFEFSIQTLMEETKNAKVLKNVFEFRE